MNMDSMDLKMYANLLSVFLFPVLQTYFPNQRFLLALG